MLRILRFLFVPLVEIYLYLYFYLIFGGTHLAVKGVTMSDTWKSFMDAITARRSQYMINNALPLSHIEVEELVKRSIVASRSIRGGDVPSATRIVVIFDALHDALWERAKDQIVALMGCKNSDAAVAKIDRSFKAAAGTVMFFEDLRATSTHVRRLESMGLDEKGLEDTLGSREVAAAEFVVWTALSEAGIGASLQHYGLAKDSTLAKDMGIPPWWKMHAQMPFGTVVSPPDAKTFLPMDERSIVMGKYPSHNTDEL